MVKIIFFDMDGTLIDLHIGQMSEKTKECLRRLRQRGIRIIMATGRLPNNLPTFAGVEFDGWLTLNGSYCFDKSGLVFGNPLPPVAVERLAKNAEKLGLSISFAVEENGAFSRPERPPASGTVYQAMVQAPEEQCRGILEETCGVKIASWWAKAVDIIPEDGGKGRGIRRMLAHYGLETREAMAFGDGNNDVEMLQAVGTGIAMGNATQQLKAVADGICDPVSRDGVYHYCLQQCLL
jgi:HAD superfamily hydrolase (TIGR01484 family)